MSSSGLGDFDLSQWSAPARPAWPPAARTAVGCGSGCALLVLLQGLFLWGIVSFAMQPWPDALTVAVSKPARAVVGKPFPVKVTFTNTGQESLPVSSITLRSRSQSGLVLASPQPAPTSNVTAWGSTVWAYDHDIEPGKTWTVTVQATPSREGRVSGVLEARSGWGGKRVAISVKAAPAPAAPGPRPAPR